MTVAGTPTQPEVRQGRGWATVVLIAVAAFVFVTCETLPIGLLPAIAGDLGVSEPVTGRLVTVYAAVAAVTAAPLTGATARLGRRPLLLGVVAVFAVSNLLVALADSFPLVAAARMVGALTHGVFWSVMAASAARLLDPGRAGRATAVVFAGNSAALVLGLPLGTALGEAFGWRIAFVGAAVTGAVVLVGLSALMPPLPAECGGDLAGLSRLLRDATLARVVAVTGLAVTGHFTAYTYLVPLLRDRHGVTATGAVLLAYGVAGVMGTVVCGALVDRRPRAAALWSLTVLAVAVTVVGAARDAPALAVVAVTAWGAAMTPLPITLQTAVLRVSPTATDTASAVYVSVFQVGIGGGALVGGVLLDTAGLVAVVAAAAALLLSAGTLAARSPTAFPTAPGTDRKVGPRS